MQTFNFFTAQTPVFIHHGQGYSYKAPSLERCGYKFGSIVKTRKPYSFFVKKKKK